MKAILMVALFALLTASLPIKAEQSGVEGNIDIYSQYIWPSRQKSANPTKFASTENELGHIDLTVSKDLNISDLIIIPSARLSIPTYTGKPSNANQLVFAVAIGF